MHESQSWYGMLQGAFSSTFCNHKTVIYKMSFYQTTGFPRYSRGLLSWKMWTREYQNRHSRFKFIKFPSLFSPVFWSTNNKSANNEGRLYSDHFCKTYWIIFAEKKKVKRRNRGLLKKWPDIKALSRRRSPLTSWERI